MTKQGHCIYRLLPLFPMLYVVLGYTVAITWVVKADNSLLDCSRTTLTADQRAQCWVLEWEQRQGLGIPVTGISEHRDGRPTSFTK